VTPSGNVGEDGAIFESVSYNSYVRMYKGDPTICTYISSQSSCECSISIDCSPSFFSLSF
jgi:hypothetical protein